MTSCWHTLEGREMVERREENVAVEDMSDDRWAGVARLLAKRTDRWSSSVIVDGSPDRSDVSCVVHRTEEELDWVCIEALRASGPPPHLSNGSHPGSRSKPGCRRGGRNESKLLFSHSGSLDLCLDTLLVKTCGSIFSQ